jgi:hypothetical protein
LRVDGTLLYFAVYLESGESKQLVEQFAVVASASRGIAGFE